MRPREEQWIVAAALQLDATGTELPPVHVDDPASKPRTPAGTPSPRPAGSYFPSGASGAGTGITGSPGACSSPARLRTVGFTRFARLLYPASSSTPRSRLSATGKAPSSA